MKKLSFFALAIAGTLFTACSDKDLATAGGGNVESNLLSEGYMSLSINLPTTPSVRAANDDFDDGTTNEYNVKDCALLLFEGTSEENAQLLNAQDIIYPFYSETDDADNDNITTMYQVTAKVSGFDNNNTNKLYALAMLNYTNVMSISDGVPTFKSIVQTNGNTAEQSLKIKTATQSGSTLSELRELATKVTNLTGTYENYFFMTNAVLYPAAGSGSSNPFEALVDYTDPITGVTAPVKAKLVQLAELDPKQIKSTKEAAQANPAGDIIVERAVAKATLKVSATGVNTGAKVAATEEQEEEADVNGQVPEVLAIDASKTVWTIDNREPSTYVVRNPGYEETSSTKNIGYLGYTSAAKTYYRFVGNASVNTNAYHNSPATDDHTHGMSRDLYRTYWCIDPQYNDDNTEANPHPTGMLPTYSNGELTGALPYVSVGTTPLYCNENTFDVAHQNYRNTTRAIIKVTLEDTKTFYTINNGVERYVDDEGYSATNPDGKKSAYDKALSFVLNYLIGNTNVIGVFQNNLTTEAKQQTFEFAIDPSYFNITTERNDAGILTVINVTLSSSKLSAARVPDTQIPLFNVTPLTNAFSSTLTENSLIAAINRTVVIREYKNGEMYYEARFKHFAGSSNNDIHDLAPWNNGEYGTEAPSSGLTDAAYPAGRGGKTAEENYLGRYGMVRNNWYDVEVTAFNKLGYPADPSGQITNKDFDDPDTPDDNLQNYISARIHVLSWAKRTQGWTFQ